MNNPEPASEVVAETETGANPDLQLNPHLGHQDPDQTPPDGSKDDEAKTDEGKKASDSPPDGEDNADKQPDDQDDDKLRRKVGELAYENRQLRRDLEAKAAEGEKAGDEPEPEPLKTLKDFGYDEQQFNSYLIEKGAELGEKRARAALQTDTAATEAESRQREFEIREDAFEADNPGFKERLHAKDLMISPEMAMFIADPSSEVGLHVGDYLAQNKTEAARIAGLQPTQQFREMTKLETRIGKEVAKAKAAKTEASKAPAPPANAIDGSDPGTKAVDPSDPEDSDKMTDEEWQAARNKQLEKRRSKS